MAGDLLVAIEGRLWTSDPAFYRETLLDDAVLVFAETGPVAKREALADVERRVRERRHSSIVEFDRMQCVMPTDDSALVTYTAIARPSDGTDLTRAYCSSLYLRRDGAWKLAFHQQTPQPQQSDRLQAAWRAGHGAAGDGADSAEVRRRAIR